MMQSNIFQEVVPLLKEKKFDIDCDVFIEFMAQYHSKDWIYPSALHRELKINIKDIYEILEICVEKGIVKQYLQIYCPTCQKFTGNYYESVFEIPEFVNCVHCDTEIDVPLRNAVIIYRVL